MLIRTFLGFLGGVLAAALALQVYRTGSVDFSELVRAVGPFVIGAAVGLILFVLFLYWWVRRK